MRMYKNLHVLDCLPASVARLACLNHSMWLVVDVRMIAVAEIFCTSSTSTHTCTHIYYISLELIELRPSLNRTLGKRKTSAHLRPRASRPPRDAPAPQRRCARAGTRGNRLPSTITMGQKRTSAAIGQTRAQLGQQQQPGRPARRRRDRRRRRRRTGVDREPDRVSQHRALPRQAD